MTEKIILKMVDNGLDFILKSLETVNESGEELKYSIINLHAGIQLVFKELLYQEHWALIFQNIEHAEKEKLKSGDFMSVNHDTLMKRLQTIGEIEFDEKFLAKIRWLQKERNKTEHYQFIGTSDAFKANLVKLLTYLIPFIKTHMIETEYISSTDERFTGIVKHLHEFDDYIKERLKFIKSNLETIEIVLQCPICFQSSVSFVDESNAFCYFCDEDIDEFAQFYIDEFVDSYTHVMDGGENPLYECPDCGIETFVCLEGHQYICLSCGINPIGEELTTCDGPTCNGVILYKKYENSAHFCHYCQDYFKHA